MPKEAVAEKLSITIAIPVFNNSRSIRRVVEEALATGLKVIVVDDGSHDASVEHVADLDITLLRHKRNQGKGAAVLTAADEARTDGATHLIVLDADGQFQTGEVARFKEAVQRDSLKIYCGYREFGRSGAPGSSVFGRSFSNFWVRAIGGVAVADSQCGFRAYPLEVLAALNPLGRRFDFEVEILVRAGWAAVPIEDIPVSVSYTPPEGRTSSFRPFMDNLRITRTNTWLFLRNMLPWPHKKFTKAHTAGGGARSNWFTSNLRALLLERRSPAELAAAAALGLFLATLPLIALHSIVIIYAAMVLRLNRALAFGVSHLCSPPLVPVLCLEIGYFIRHGRWLTEASIQTLWHQAGDRILDYVVGSLVVAPLLAAVGGVSTFLVAKRLSVGMGPVDEKGEPQRINATYGSNIGIEIFRLVIKYFGTGPAYLCLLPVVPFYLVFRPSVRRSMRPYLHRRFPERSAPSYFLLSARWLFEFCRTLVDQAAVGVRGLDFVDYTVERRAELARLISGERGVVFLMTHMGPWMLTPSFLDVTGKPLNLLIHRDRAAPPKLMSGFLRNAGQVRIIDPTLPFGGLLEARAALEKGELAGIMGDRSWGGRTIRIPLLGSLAAVPESPYRLARAGEATIVALVVERVKSRTFKIDWLEIASDTHPGDLRSSYRKQASAYMRFVEKKLESCPFSWANHSDMWNTL